MQRAEQNRYYQGPTTDPKEAPMAHPPDDELRARLEAMANRPVPARPAHLRMTAAQLRARIDAMPQSEQDRLVAEVEVIHRQVVRSRRWYRRDPEDVGAIFSFVAGLGCVIASPFVGDAGDPTYLIVGVLLVITVISWAIAQHLRYRR